MSSNQTFDGAGPLAERFRPLFLAQLGHLPYRETFTDRYELSMPAPNAELGELRVRDDGDELTIVVGPHHWHVPLYHFEDESAERRADLVAEAAMDDIRRLVEGRTVIRVRRRLDGSIGSTSSIDLDSMAVGPAGANEVDYPWTGPR